MQADPVVPSREPANGMANTISAPKEPPVHSQTGWRNAAAYPLHTPFSYAKRSYTLSAPREKEEDMVKAVVLWERAPDAEWYSRHAELCKKVPGATFRAGRIFGSPAGEPDRHQYAEFEFSDRAAFDKGMTSAEMGAAVEDGQTQGIPFHVYFVELG